MPNELPLPEELQHLLEKREDGDRRTQQEGDDPDGPDCAPTANTSEAAAEAATVTPDTQRHRQTDRRK